MEKKFGYVIEYCVILAHRTRRVAQTELKIFNL